MGGFGKSWLAAWAYAELGRDFDKRLWVNFRRDLWQDYGFDRFARWVLQEIGFPQKDPTAKEDLPAAGANLPTQRPEPPSKDPGGDG